MFLGLVPYAWLYLVLYAKGSCRSLSFLVTVTELMLLLLLLSLLLLLLLLFDMLLIKGI